MKDRERLSGTVSPDYFFYVIGNFDFLSHKKGSARMRPVRSGICTCVPARARKESRSDSLFNVAYSPAITFGILCISAAMSVKELK